MRIPSTLSFNRPFGFHQLAHCPILENTEAGYGQLREAAKIATRVGAKIFELACPPLCQIPADIVARILLSEGVREVAYCVIFTVNREKEVPDGDPLSKTPLEVTSARATFRKHLDYIHMLRACGITVKYMTGPSCFAIGRDYADPLFNGHRSRQDLNDAIVLFYSQFTTELKDMKLTVCIEFLRYGEDCGALESVDTVIEIIKRLGGITSPFRFHADLVHMLERDQDPEQVLLEAGEFLGYLHAHGRKRIAPGTFLVATTDDDVCVNDLINWYRIGRILDQIGYVGPVIPEPFGQAIRDAIKELGEGLPPAVPAEPYYTQAHAHLIQTGVVG